MDSTKTWGEKVASHTEFLRAQALKLAKDPYLVQDLVQDALMLALKSEDKFDGQNLAGWLWTITRNTFINTYRRDKKYSAVSLSDDLNEAGLLSSSSENGAIAAFTEADIRQAIGELPQSLKTITLRRMEGLKYHEIAKVEKIKVGTVRSSLFRARQLLPEKSTF